MYNIQSSPTLVNCIFNRNADIGLGRDMVNEGDSASTTVTNCTFRNFAPSMYNLSSSPTVTNCIFWGAFLDETIINSATSSPVVTYCAFQIIPYPGTGNITIGYNTPFVSEGGGDLHLKPSVPCIDAGNNDAPDLPTTDIDGDDRRIDDPTVIDTGNGTAPIVDMGADEFAG